MMIARQFARVLCLALVLGLAGRVSADEADLKSLLDGVSQIAAPGAPGSLCAFGEGAFAVVAGNASGALQEPVVGAARVEKGRAVIFGHDGYLGPESLAVADTGRLMVNAVRWVAGGAPPRVAVHGLPGLLAFLQKQGLTAEALDGPGWTGKLTSFSVLCVHPGNLSASDELPALAGFLRAGGGLIAGDTGWGWLQLHPGKTLTEDHAGNRLLAPAGLMWNDGFLGRTSLAGFAADNPPSELLQAGRALDALEAHARGQKALVKEDLAQVAWVLTHAARTVPPGDAILLPRLRRLQQEHAAEALPTPEKPLTMEQPLGRLALTLQLEEFLSRRLPPEQTRAHPAAASFPGAVPADAPRVMRTIAVDTKVPGWHSTGLYAAPGGVVEVRVPDGAAGKGLLVRLGAHADALWGLPAWRRCPEVCRQEALAKSITRAANAFGGPVYIEVPGGCALGTVQVDIQGAVEAPCYVRGNTDVAEWRSQIRLRPGPWAELEGTRVILTVPSTAVRQLDDPQALMEFWDQVLDCCADLAGRPRERERPERYVTDVQIGAGYMHSGYPIMTHLDIAPVMVDVPRLKANAHLGVWGLFHEMGHNHQSGDWTFDGTGEVTENLFSLYVLERACGIKANGHPAITAEARTKAMAKYFGDGAKFQDWKSQPFLALMMYMQLQEAFGWDAFIRVFTGYRALPADAHPKTDDEKRDQWLVRFSRAVGRNLGPFFQAWGVPTSKKARADVADLPAWMPEGFPPRP